MHAELAFCLNLLPKHLETSESGFALVTCLPAVSILASYITIATNFFHCHKNRKTLICRQQILLTQLQAYGEKCVAFMVA